MKKQNKYLFAALVVLISMKGYTQEAEQNPLDTLVRTVQNLEDEIQKSKRLKITGYIQPQWQHIETDGAASFAGGDFGPGMKDRITMRRGRFKFTYENGIATYMLNTDATEKGYNLRETYVRLRDPWMNISTVTIGLLQVPFGFEPAQSSGIRETPERARYNQTLFPTERDLGVFGTIGLPKGSMLYGLNLTAAVMNGSAGVSPEFDSYKDFVARLVYNKTTRSENLTYRIGTSYYYGGYRVGKEKDKVLSGTQFVFAKDTSNYNRRAMRNYVAADAEIAYDWFPGMTTIRGEYVQGEQPGTDKSSKSLGALPSSTIYHRMFNGAYFYFIQNIGQSRFQLVAKYDWYDPNVKLKGSDISKTNGANPGDIKYDTYGFGINTRITPNVKLMVYYDIVKNEKTQLAGYTSDIRDNVTTVRVQYKFD